MAIPGPLKKILRPPYRMFRAAESGLQRSITEGQIRARAKPMIPPAQKVRKSRKLERILLAVMKYDYGCKGRGLSYEYYNVCQPLSEMGYETELFDFLTICQEEGKDRMNSLLWDRVRSFEPDFVFFALYEEQFDKRTIRRISEETPATTFNWFADDDWRFHIFTKFWAPCFNYCSTTIKEALPLYHALGYHNVIQTQWAANDSIYRKLGSEKDIDVSFVGQPHSNRRMLVGQIEKSGTKVECFGRGWPNGYVDQKKMISVFNRSKINLNFTANSTGTPAQIKSRFFEVTACGGFLLSEYARNLEDYFEIGKELDIFDGKEELAEKIAKYLENDAEREGIANAGYKRTVGEHTYRKRFDSIFKRIGYGDKAAR